MFLKKLIKKLVSHVSFNSTLRVVSNDRELKKIWDDSLETFPDFSQHFSIPTVEVEEEARIRMLIAAETSFVYESIERIKNDVTLPVTFADIGDSDGSVRYLLSKMYADSELDSIGLNLQAQAVAKMKKLGLKAICENAMDLSDKEMSFDIVSVFETLEHLSDPIGFLKSMSKIVNKELIISVPYLRKSRVGLQYLNKNWPEEVKSTIENQHIFELSPTDWKKLMIHSGWKIQKEKIIKAYPRLSYHRLILEPYWRYMSFDGFWFVSLTKDNTISRNYSVE